MDLRFETEEFFFGMRASVVILNKEGDKLLVHHSLKFNHRALPGGGIAGLETSSETAKRELEEEIGAEIEVKNCIAVIENFFDAKGLKQHEVQFVYLAEFKDPKMYERETFEPAEERKKGKLEFMFIPIDDLEKYDLKPSCLIDVIRNKKFDRVNHIITK